MPPLCWAPTRALGRTLVRSLSQFQPIPTLRRPLLACLPSHRSPGSWPRSRYMSESVKWISDDLQYHKEDKWGWIIYRTTYNDDAAWELFKDRINKWTRIDDPDAPPAVLRGMDWTFNSDRSTLDGASREQLRERFRAWRKTAVQAENPRRDPAVTFMSGRYRFFLQVDEESLQSVVEGGGNVLDGSWVNLVRCDDEMDEYIQSVEEDKERDIREPWDQEDEELGTPPKPEDKWWMMVSTDMIGAEFYTIMVPPLEIWWIYYREPPEVLWS